MLTGGLWDHSISELLVQPLMYGKFMEYAHNGKFLTIVHTTLHAAVEFSCKNGVICMDEVPSLGIVHMYRAHKAACLHYMQPQYRGHNCCRKQAVARSGTLRARRPQEWRLLCQAAALLLHTCGRHPRVHAGTFNCHEGCWHVALGGTPYA